MTTGITIAWAIALASLLSPLAAAESQDGGAQQDLEALDALGLPLLLDQMVAPAEGTLDVEAGPFAALEDGAAGPIGSQLSVNDNFASATTVSSFAFFTSGNNALDTTQAGEDLACGSTPYGHTVWYKVVPSVTGMLHADTWGSSLDTVLTGYQGTSLAGLSEKACNDDDPAGGLHSVIGFPVFAGTTYYIQLGGYLTDSGAFDLYIDVTAGCSGNDDWANACPVVFLPYTNAQSTAGATIQFGETAPACGSNVGKTVWYTYTAPPGLPVSRLVDTHGSGFDTVLDVWLAPSGNPVAPVACNDDDGSPNNASSLRFTAVPGMTYLIRVGGYNGASGNLVFNMP